MKNNNWKETTLREIGRVVTGKTPPTSISAFYGGIYPFITPTDIKDDFNYCKAERYLSEDGKEFQKSILLLKNSVCYTCIASIGKICLTNQDSFTNQQINSVIIDEKKAHYKFIFYLLKYLTPQIKKMAGGTITGIINKNQFENFIFEIPKNINEQQQIAAVLSSLDDKIELLRRQNETLEKIAQGIFKEWFVNFTIDGKKLKLKNGVPEEWKVGKLTDIADFLNGFAMQKFPAKGKTEYLPVIKIKEMNSGITDQTDKASKNIPEKYVVNNGDILFSWSGSLDIDIWKYGKGALNQHLFKVTSEKYPKWFYFYWIKYHLPNFRQIATAKAVTMGHIQKHHLDDAQVLIPNSDNLKNANDMISPIFEKTILNNSQIQTLSRLRDTLLPRLMSGEIKINL